MSSSLDSGGHYSVSSNNNNNNNNNNNSNNNSNNSNNSNINNNSANKPNNHNSSNNPSNHYNSIGYQVQQSSRHPPSPSPSSPSSSQQQMFYSNQDYHQQNTQRQQQRHPDTQYPQHHPPSSSSSNSQYNPNQQDMSRHAHFDQQQHLQQFDGYGQQLHYQDQPQSARGQQQQSQIQMQGQSSYSQDQAETGSISASISATSTPRSEIASNLRFRISLEAQTAAMQRQDETPVTYLNKGQFYSVALQDTDDYDGEVTSVIKVTFHDPSHRRLAARYWSFWLSQQPNPKTARALDIEKASSTGILEVQSKTFDRISFKWNGKAGAKLMVRFNCLSTDFSRIKGVKGIPLRVHIDSHVEGDNESSSSNKNSAGGQYSTPMERSFAKIKLFRDKGAERKNKDDHKHLEKMWDKMRGKNADTNPLVNILAPVQSMSLFSECLDHPEGSGEEETLDLSDTLNYETGIEGSGGDGESTHSNNERASSSRPGSEGALDSPTSTGDSNLAVVPVNKKRRRDTDGGANSLVDNNSINHSSNNSNNGSGTFYDPQQSQVGFPSSAQSSNSLVIAGSNNGSSALITSEQFLDRDPNYVPISRKKRPVLCLYIKIGGESVYRAVYLEKYTLTDLISKLSEKLEIQSSTISCVYRKTIKKELLVRVDDAMVAQMTDELDMVVEYDFNQQDGSVNLTLKY